METSEKNLGKTLYIVNKYDKKIIEGKIIFAEEDTHNGKPFMRYKVAVNEGESIFGKYLTLDTYHYKNSYRWSTYNFYFVKEQAEARLAQLKLNEEKEQIRRLNTVNRNVVLEVDDIKGCSRNEVLNILLAEKLACNIFNQSQYKQLLNTIDELLNIANNADSLIFKAQVAYKDFNSLRKDLIYVNPNDLTFNFVGNICLNKLKKASLYIRYANNGFRLSINIKKWKKFFHINKPVEQIETENINEENQEIH